MHMSGELPLNIILIGFMACGKSTVGRNLFDLLGYPLIDTDSVIEQRAGKSVRQIFADEGEDAFREAETELLRELATTPATPQIIATGGGIVVRPENRMLLRRLGYVVWLRAPLATIVRRTRRNNARPLLQTEDPVARITGLLEKRDPWYRECAHLRLDTAGLDSRELAVGILESARVFFTSQPTASCPPP